LEFALVHHQLASAIVHSSHGNFCKSSGHSFVRLQHVLFATSLVPGPPPRFYLAARLRGKIWEEAWELGYCATCHTRPLNQSLHTHTHSTSTQYHILFLSWEMPASHSASICKWSNWSTSSENHQWTW